MTNTSASLVHVEFVDGSQRWVHPAVADDVVGLDMDGDLLVPFCGEFAPLTPCCHASGKGSSSGVVCRSCYYPVGVKFGMTRRLAVARKS